MRELVRYGRTGEWEKIVGVSSEGGKRVEVWNKKRRKKAQQGIRGLMANSREEEASPTTVTVEKGEQDDWEGTPVREELSRWDRQGSAFGNEGRDWSLVANSLQGTSRLDRLGSATPEVLSTR